MILMNLPMKTDCPPLVGGSSYKYPAGHSHVLGEITPHRNVKTVGLGVKLHQCNTDNLLIWIGE